MSNVILVCHVLDVICDMSNVIQYFICTVGCLMSPVISVYHMSYVGCHMSYVGCHLSYVGCHMSDVMQYVICQMSYSMSYVGCHMSNVIQYVISRMSYVTCHTSMSYVICRMSYVICRMSYVICRMSYFGCHTVCDKSDVICHTGML